MNIGPGCSSTQGLSSGCHLCRRTVIPMAHDITPRSVRSVAVAVILTAGLVTAGCSAGQVTQTAAQASAVPGAEADAGPIALRNLLIPFREGGYPAGGDVPLVVRLASTSGQPVEVTAAPAPAGDATTVPAQQIAVASASTATTTTTAPTALTVPPSGVLDLVPPDGVYLVAGHIASAFTYGEEIPVRFAFSTGDAVVVDIPMAPPDYPTAG